MANSNKFLVYISARSPFARRVRLALDRLGFEYEEKIIDVFNPPAEFIKRSPLGLVPVLITPEGMTITDSTMILEYLHQRTGAIYPNGMMEWPIRQASVFGNGVIQSMVSFFQERKMHEVPSPRWLHEHADMASETLKELERAPASIWWQEGKLDGGFTQAAWDLCVALEYLTLRFSEYEWEKRHPVFLELLEFARKNKKFSETQPQA